MHAVHIYFAGVHKGFLNRFAGDFVEHYPAIAAFVTAYGFPQVPCNRLTLTVEVCCKENCRRILRQAL